MVPSRSPLRCSSDGRMSGCGCRVSAFVTTAVALTDAQEQRLTAILGRLYGRTIGLQVTVDPDVLGGLVIRVGDEVIDGSVVHRLEAAGRRLTG